MCANYVQLNCAQRRKNVIINGLKLPMGNCDIGIIENNNLKNCLNRF